MASSRYRVNSSTSARPRGAGRAVVVCHVHQRFELWHGEIDREPGLVLGRPHVLEEQPGTVQDAFDELNAIVHHVIASSRAYYSDSINSSCSTNSTAQWKVR